MFDYGALDPTPPEAPESGLDVLTQAHADGGDWRPLPEPGPPSWSQHAPDGLLADMLDGLLSGVCDQPDPVGRDPQDRDFEAVERIAAWERVIAWAQARQIREVAGFAGRAQSDPPPGVAPGDAVSSAAAEVGLALRLAPRTANQRVAQALSLAERLPATLAALRAGRISLPHARAIDQETHHLTADQAGAVEDAVLGRAPNQTPSQLRAATRRAALRVDPDSARERHRQQRRDRGVHYYDDPDGMATLSAYLPAPEAAAAYATIDTHARRTGGPGDDRTMDARRADALVDLILDGIAPTSPPDRDGPTAEQPSPADAADPGPYGTAAAAAAPASASAAPAAGPTPGATHGWPDAPAALRSASRAAAQIRVTVPLTALLGLDDQPGELAGYGPVPAEAVRELAADAPLHPLQRILTDPRSGALLDYGTTRYTPPAHLTDHVTTRDQTCRFPGCRTPAHRCPPLRPRPHRTPRPRGQHRAHQS